MDPQRALQILHLPIRAIRVITDPIVDFVVYLLVELLLPPALRTIYKLTQLVLSIGLIFIRLMLGEGVQDRVSAAWVGMVRSYLTLDESNLIFSA